MNAKRLTRQWLRGAALLGCCTMGQAAEMNPHNAPGILFQTSDRCVACHNGMITTRGEEVSIGSDWGVTLMANASRDPYWQASVRKETADHPESQAKIENECSACHMPIPQYQAKQKGELGTIFSHLPLGTHGSKEAADGVTCSVCHQITPQNLRKPESYNGNFVIADAASGASHAEYGPYDIGTGLQQVMRSSTAGLQPEQGDQIRSAELCASCHTLITEARGENGAIVGTLPEQMPYQEWLHSDFKHKRTCQSCHMPAVEGEVPITRILGANRAGVARHQFVGANFLMQRLLGRYHDELDAAAPSAEFAEAADRTISYLQKESAAITLTLPRLRGGRLEEDVTVENLGGHKLPTAFPSRRAWLHVVVRDRNQRTVFESGAVNADGSIVGNDNDDDPTRFEPHYSEIRMGDQVQIYEAILEDTKGAVTTGILAAVNYIKDNRLLPRGFDKKTVPGEIAVHGTAVNDAQFTDQGHRIRYSVDVGDAEGPFEVDAELLYQPIGFRWAMNLNSYSSDETQHFGEYFQSMAGGSAVSLVKATQSSR